MVKEFLLTILILTFREKEDVFHHQMAITLKQSKPFKLQILNTCTFTTEVIKTKENNHENSVRRTLRDPMHVVENLLVQCLAEK